MSPPANDALSQALSTAKNILTASQLQAASSAHHFWLAPPTQLSNNQNMTSGTPTLLITTTLLPGPAHNNDVLDPLSRCSVRASVTQPATDAENTMQPQFRLWDPNITTST